MSRLIGAQKSQIESGQINFFVTILFKTSYVTGYPLSYILGNENLDEDFELPSLNLENDDRKKEYIDKSKKVLIYLIKHEMLHQGISIQQLAVKTKLTKSYLYNLLKYKENVSLKYLILLKIVEDGFGIQLQDFFSGKNSTHLTFEELIDQFDTIDFDIFQNNIADNNENDNIISYYTESMTNKLLKLLEMLKEVPHPEGLRALTREFKEHKSHLIRIVKLLRVAHVFNTTPLELLEHRDLSSLKPINLERLSDQKIQDALDTLAENIQMEMEASRISVYDLQVSLGMSNPHNLYPLLNARTTSTYYKFIQISKGIYDIKKDNEEFLVFLKHLLRNISTLSH